MTENQAPQPNRYEEESRQARAATQKLKRNMLIIMGVLVVVMAVGLIAVNFLEDTVENWRMEGKETYSSGKPQGPMSGIEHCEPDYKTNILTDPSYLELYRAIRMDEGIRVYELESSHYQSEPSLAVLADLVDALVAGDAEAYNALFSDRYYEDPNHIPESRFPMQRLYNITITLESSSVKTAEDGSTYNEYVYSLRYMIDQNSGIYRPDIGDEEISPQYFWITDRTVINGENVYQIDDLRYP